MPKLRDESKRISGDTHINKLGSKKRRRECVTDKHDKDESGNVSGDGSDRDNELDSLFGALEKEKKQKKNSKVEPKLARGESNRTKAKFKTSFAAATAERDTKAMIGRAQRDCDPDDRMASTFAFQAPSVHRFTPEGLPVYKYFHLGMRQDDGGTAACPFDCNCCF